MYDNVATQQVIEELLPERMERLRRVAGVPVVLGGATRHCPDGPMLVLGRAVGTLGDSLIGLTIGPGLGLGGSVIRRGIPLRVGDYATEMGITHDFDHAVVQMERLTSIVAAPIVLDGDVRGVLYGAVRGRCPLGDRTLRAVTVLADQLQHDVEQRFDRRLPDAGHRPSHALAELVAIIRDTTDPALRARLVRIQLRIQQGLASQHGCGDYGQRLSPREVAALRLVEVGESNVGIATSLGLSVETVKAYLRSAMRKLEVHNRTAATHRARLRGEL